MSKSLPMPRHYSSKFEWAADWVGDNGMTLPPDTPELRSLRNWFCFKLNQFKKGTLGSSNEAELERWGLDFARYEATNTGKGHRPPDGLMIEMLRDWRRESGSYDLSNSSPPELITYHHRLTDTFSVRGYTERSRNIEAALDGFRIPLWRHAAQVPVTFAEQDWWNQAYYYDSATKHTPAYLGVLHPKADETAAAWAVDQISRASQLNALQRGFLVGQGLLVNKAARKVHQRREADRMVEAGVSLDDPQYGMKDRRLDSFLGQCMYLRMRVVKSSEKEIMAAFGIDPEALLELHHVVGARFEGSNVSHITDVRHLYLQFGEEILRYASMEAIERKDEMRPIVLRPFHVPVLKAVHCGLQHYRSQPVSQDIAIY